MLGDTVQANDDDEAFKQALDHTWNWFALHASQRMHLINYFIVAAAFITAGYAAMLANDQYRVAAAVAVGGALVSVAFERLDIRTRELIRIAEAALSQLEERLVARTGIRELHFVDLVDKPATRATSYRFVLRAVTRTSAVLFIAGFVYAVVGGS